MHGKVVGVIVLLALVMTFVLQNGDVVTIRFLFWAISMPRALMVLAVLLIGFVVGWIFKGLASRGERP